MKIISFVLAAVTIFPNATFSQQTAAEIQYLERIEAEQQRREAEDRRIELYEIRVMLAVGKMQDSCPQENESEKECLRRVRAVANIVGCAFFEDIVERIECYDRAAGRALVEGPWDYPQRE